jgi:hypothetical protein
LGLSAIAYGKIVLQEGAVETTSPSIFDESDDDVRIQATLPRTGKRRLIPRAISSALITWAPAHEGVGGKLLSRRD